MSSAAAAAYLKSIVFNTFAGYAFPVARAVGCRRISLVRSEPKPDAAPRNLDTEQPFSYCYELPA